MKVWLGGDNYFTTTSHCVFWVLGFWGSASKGLLGERDIGYMTGNNGHRCFEYELIN